MNDRTRAGIVVERTYRARVEELWELWTTKEGFESWWGPQDFRADVHTLEARPGGAPYAAASSACLPGNGRNAIRISTAASPMPHEPIYISA